ncbi:MAG: hypothetical protein EOO45_14775 [Flavobacterium sp.]|nr:MAG: hypothetical protein EOO45_14775 [Flavobacterium sp.]
MKNSKISFCLWLLLSAFMGLVVSCSGKTEKAEIEMDSVENTGSNKQSGIFKEGEIIGTFDPKGEFVFKISKDSIFNHFEEVSGSDDYSYADVEVVKVPIEGTSDTEYLLLATSSNKAVKSAIAVTYDASSKNVSIPAGSDAAVITCSSPCTSGCNPTVLVNPTGQKEITCSDCSDGSECTKSVTVSY